MLIFSFMLALLNAIINSEGKKKTEGYLVIMAPFSPSPRTSPLPHIVFCYGDDVCGLFLLALSQQFIALQKFDWRLIQPADTDT